MSGEKVEDVLKEVVLPTDSLGKTLKSLHRATLSVQNRLRSIVEDAEFVEEAARTFGYPLVANERCGSWYVPPSSRAANVYFKSTDGHANQWAFSSRRLNLHLLDVVAKSGGAVIVDSTRRGKVMPDALSKTVPIWCAVMNRLVFPEALQHHQLFTPPKCVSPSEHTQIEAKLDSFLIQLKALQLDVNELRRKSNKPLRPLWLTRDSILPTAPPTYEDFTPLVLCTASRQVVGGDIAADGYVQGAGDDNEGWSRGLTADLFWENHRALLGLKEDDTTQLITKLLEAKFVAQKEAPAEAVLIVPTTWLYIATDSILASKHSRTFGRVFHCSQEANISMQNTMKVGYVHLQCRAGKLGSRDLRRELSKVIPDSLCEEGIMSILVCCPTGEDLAIGVALVLLCLKDLPGQASSIGKDYIRQRLSWISSTLSNARPSRATLQSVNDFLMTGGERPP